MLFQITYLDRFSFDARHFIETMKLFCSLLHTHTRTHNFIVKYTHTHSHTQITNTQSSIRVAIIERELSLRIAIERDFIDSSNLNIISINFFFGANLFSFICHLLVFFICMSVYLSFLTLP